MRMIGAAVIVGFLAVASLVSQGQPPRKGRGLEFVLTIEAQRQPGVQQPSIGDRFMDALLPDRHAEVDYVTDGSSARKTVRGRLPGLPNGSVTLALVGDNKQYVLDPAARTYYIILPDSAVPDDHAVVTITPTTVYQPVQGFKARQVGLLVRETIPAPPGQRASGNVQTELRVEGEYWCSEDVPVSDSLTRILPTIRSARQRLTAACSFPLMSRVRYSAMPEYTVVSSVISLRPSTPSADLFAIPSGYREVPPPR